MDFKPGVKNSLVGVLLGIVLLTPLLSCYGQSDSFPKVHLATEGQYAYAEPTPTQPSSALLALPGIDKSSDQELPNALSSGNFLHLLWILPGYVIMLLFSGNWHSKLLYKRRDD